MFAGRRFKLTTKALSTQPIALTNERLAKAADTLATIDEDLSRVLKKHGPPPLWARAPDFATLIRIVLEQQVSLASADAMFSRLVARVRPLTPQRVLAVDAPFLRSFGITRQKAGYCINIAKAIRTNQLDLVAVGKADDRTALQMLTGIKGVGPWTAEIYLLMALGRPDVLPAGDIALATAVQKLRNLPQRPKPRELAEIGKVWSPHRATAARMLWQYYLSGMSNGELQSH